MILASQSPRRRELLAVITPDFEVIPAVGEEILPPGITPENAVTMLSRQKAEEIKRRKFPDVMNVPDTIIAADTVVAAKGEILGKPHDNADAERMLKLLSGSGHSVFTGVAIISGNKTLSFAEETTVVFYDLTDEEIARYIATGEPLDKAGAYGIQGFGSLLVKEIRGDYYNVMGLPIGRINRELKMLGLG